MRGNAHAHAALHDGQQLAPAQAQRLQAGSRQQGAQFLRDVREGIHGGAGGYGCKATEATGPAPPCL